MEEDLRHRQSSTNISSLLPALEFLKPYKLKIFIAVISIIYTASLSLSFGQILRVVVDKGYLSSSSEMLAQAVGLFLALMLLISVGTFIRFNLVLKLGERISADIRKRVFDHVIELNPAFFDENLSGEIQTRITTDTAIVQSVMSMSMSMATRNFIILLGGIILMMVSNIKLSLIVFSMIIFVVIPLRYFGAKVRGFSRISQDEIANAGAYVGETLQNIKTVHAFNHQNIDKENFETHIERTYDAGVKHIWQRSILIASIFALITIAFATTLWIGGNDVLNGAISSGELVAFAFYAGAVGMAVATISEVAGDILRAAGAMERIMEMLATKNNLLSNTKAETTEEKVPAIAPEQMGSIVMNAVGFHYPSRPDKKVLNGLTLNIQPGETIALVGYSGAGKSTLFDLLMRFYDPSEGNIEIDGQDISKLELNNLREKFALVPQNPSVFTGNILMNIRYGKPDASIEEVKAAAKGAYADEFIEQLPQQYDTFIGESGMQLSGGQRQRLAIARAILRDPEILLLDEATSALDAKSEKIVQLALEELMRNRTSIVIAHRLATVINADRIAVMDKGEIIQIGNHKELLKSSTLYAKLAELQFNH